MKNSPKVFSVVVVVLLLAGAGFYYFSQKSSSYLLGSHPDWRTYVNEEAGYSIQYPQGGVDMFESVSATKVGVKNVEFSGLNISVNAKGFNLDYNETCSNGKEAVTIDKVEWEKVNCKRGYFGGEPDILVDYNLDRNNLLYKIVVNYGPKSKKKSMEIAETMLRTFKFIPVKSTVSKTDSMKAYTNDQMKISFQYPADWTILAGENIVAKTAAPYGELRFDIYKFQATEVAMRPDLKETGGCKVSESTEGVQLKCTDTHLSKYVIRFADSMYSMHFTKNLSTDSREETDPDRIRFNQLTTEMFERNKDSFEKILQSVRFLR